MSPAREQPKQPRAESGSSSELNTLVTGVRVGLPEGPISQAG